MTLTLARPGGNLAADRIGSGPAIVLLSGLGDARTSYRHLAPRLAAAGFTVYRIDNRGHGDSDTGFASYTTEDIASDAIALLDHEGVDRAILVGNSIGGGAATWAAQQAPERFEKLVLLNPFVRDMPLDPMLRALVPLLLARPWGAALWGAYRRRLFVTPPEDQRSVSTAYLTTLSDPARLAALRQMLCASKAGVGAALGSVRADTLIVMGAQDPDYPDPAAEGEEVARRLGGPARVAVIQQCGHYPQAEHPDQVAHLIREHLDAGASNAA